MVAVGDENRLVGNQSTNGCDRRIVDHRPDPVDHTQVVNGCDRGTVSHAFFETCQNGVGLVWIESEDRAEVCPSGFEQVQAIRLWTT